MPDGAWITGPESEEWSVSDGAWITGTKRERSTARCRSVPDGAWITGTKRRKVRNRTGITWSGHNACSKG